MDSDKPVESNNPEQKDSIWNELLRSNVRNDAGLQKKKTIIILGYLGAGKRTLVENLVNLHPRSSTTPSSQGLGLDYTYLEGKDDESDDTVHQVGVWVLNERSQARLLSMALTPQTIQHSIICVCLDGSKPWRALKDLNDWLEVIEERMGALLPSLSSEIHNQMKESLIQTWKDYDAKRQLIPGDSKMVPLGEGVLEKNLGLSINVVMCKSDALRSFDKAHGFQDSHFYFIQASIRRVCLKYGASLMYTSCEENLNINLLHQYMFHRLFRNDVPFEREAQIQEKERSDKGTDIFVPMGYDSKRLIENLFKQLGEFHIATPFEEAIKDLTPKLATGKLDVVEPADDQKFLESLYIQMAGKKATLPRTDVGAPSAGAAPRQSIVGAKPILQRSQSTFAAGLASGAAEDHGTLLKSFFMNLKGGPVDNQIRQEVEDHLKEEKKKTSS